MSLQSDVQNRLRLKLDLGIGDVLASAEEAQVSMDNIRRKAKAEKWEDTLLQSRLIEEAGRIATTAKEIFRSVATAGSVLGGLYEGSDGDPDAVFVWQGVDDVRRCPDCKELHGADDTMYNWLSRGLPGSGETICGGWCRCELVPAGWATDEGVIIPKNQE